MIYGIHFGAFSADPRNKFRIVYNSGFRSCMLFLGGNLDDAIVVETAREEGLYVENVHSPFKGINDIWLDNLDGEEMFAKLMRTLDQCNKFGIPTTVVHASSGTEPPPISEIGTERFRRLIDTAEKYEINYALENQRSQHYLDYLYKTFPSPYLKFCYDAGHENCFEHTKILLSKFKDKLVALHLHDNSGVHNADEHLIPFNGTVDWDYVREGIKDYKGVTALELRRDTTIPEEEFYAAAFEAATKIR